MESSPFRYCCGSGPLPSEKTVETHITNPQDIIRNLEQLWAEVKSLRKDVARLQEQNKPN